MGDGKRAEEEIKKETTEYPNFSSLKVESLLLRLITNENMSWERRCAEKLVRGHWPVAHKALRSACG